MPDHCNYVANVYITNVGIIGRGPDQYQALKQLIWKEIGLKFLFLPILAKSRRSLEQIIQNWRLNLADIKAMVLWKIVWNLCHRGQYHVW